MVTKQRFWDHNLLYSRHCSAKRMEAARAQKAIPVSSEYQILHLIDIVERGLPNCYTSFKDFLFDFWPEFSWTGDSGVEIKAVLGDPRFKKIVLVLKETWGVDMIEELQAGLTAIEIQGCGGI